MSRMLVLAAAVTLLGVAACNNPTEELAKPVAEQPVARPDAAAGNSAVLTHEQAMVLAAKGNCLFCHKIDVKVVGPAWKNVAEKYRGDANAATIIASNIKVGGSFGWEIGVMPPRGGSSNISEAEIDRLAKFIASLK